MEPQVEPPKQFEKIKNPWKVDDSEQPTQKIKILLLGDSGVGKSAMVSRLKIDEYDSRYYAHRGSNSSFACMRLSTDRIVRFDFIQYNGETRLGVLNNAPFTKQDFQVLIVMFDVTCRGSYNAALQLHKEFKRLFMGVQVPTIFVGNKIMEDVNRLRFQNQKAWGYDEYEPVPVRYAEENFIPYVEVDVRYDYNVRGLFLEVAKMVMKEGVLRFPILDRKQQNPDDLIKLTTDLLDNNEKMDKTRKMLKVALATVPTYDEDDVLLKITVPMI